MSKPIKHTPGPWRLGSVFNERVQVEQVGGLHFRIAVLHDDAERLTTDGKDATKANARLIAAAPELLRELRSLLVRAEVQCAKIDKPLIDQCYATIAKATGGES